MNIKKIYEAGKKGLVGIALASALVTGCDSRIEPIARQEMPYFAVKNLEAVWSMDYRKRLKHIENDVTYTPLVRFDKSILQLDGVVAQRGDETYIFRSGMYDGHLTEIRNPEGEAYLRAGMLPKEFKSFNNKAGKGADTSYASFIEELNTEK